ncbi:MAG: inositol monophosphatase family protein [Patescibacteria group bacterium]
MTILNFLTKTARSAGNLVLKGSKTPLKITKKGENDLVTQIDKASERLIIREIKSAFPDHSIIAEESSFKETSIGSSKYIWFIDPLDGTTNFVHGLPFYSVSIALFKTNGNLVAGIVYAPALNEIFYAEEGKGAFLNGKKIHVSKTKTVKDSLLVTGFPYNDKKINLPYFALMLSKSQAVRRLGSAALDLCYTAAGRFDGYWEFGLKPWDIAAGALIIKEAGGLVTDTSGNLLDLFGADILATNKNIHKEMVKDFEKL